MLLSPHLSPHKSVLSICLIDRKFFGRDIDRRPNARPRAVSVAAAITTVPLDTLCVYYTD